MKSSMIAVLAFALFLCSTTCSGINDDAWEEADSAKKKDYDVCATSAECESNVCAYNSGSTQACKPKTGFEVGKPCYYARDCADSRQCAYTSKTTLACKPKAGFAVGQPCYYSRDCADSRKCAYTSKTTLACRPKAGFADGQPCYYAADCEGKACTGGKCGKAADNYASCQHHADCKTRYCRYAGDFPNCKFQTKQGPACQCLPKNEFADGKGCYWSSDCNSGYCGCPQTPPSSGGKYACLRRRRLPPADYKAAKECPGQTSAAKGKRPQKGPPKDPCQQYKEQKQADEELAKTLKETIRFQPNDVQLTEAGKAVVAKIAQTLKKNPWIDIEIEGDSTISGPSCVRLTTGRADTTAKYLQSLDCKNKMKLTHKCQTFIGMRIASTGGVRTAPPGCHVEAKL